MRHVRSWVIVLAVSLMCSLLIGSTWIHPGDVVDVLLGAPRSRAHQIAVWDVRLPRTIIGGAGGAMLGASGAMLQMLVRNALGSPDLTGITAGGILGAVLAVTAGAGSIAVSLAAVAGAALVSTAVLGLGWSSLGSDPRRLALVGVVLAAVVGAVTSLALIAGGGNPDVIVRWMVGSLESRSWSEAGRLATGLVVALPLTLIAIPACNLSVLGPSNVTAVGGRPRFLAGIILGASCVLAGSAVAALGAVAFVGLIAPHIARTITGAGARSLVPVSGVVGASLLVVADITARTFSLGWLPGLADGPFDARRLPVGVFTAVLGGVLFVRIARRT